MRGFVKFEVYCDESRPDLFTTGTLSKDQFLLIGSIWLPADQRALVKKRIKILKDHHKVGGQIKWQKVSNSRLDFYKEVVDLFMSFGHDLRFRCIAIKASKVDFQLFHNDDKELGFYKFYYQLLHHWILDFNDYFIFCDIKTNRNPKRLQDLKQCLQKTNLSSKVISIQSLPSSESALIQLADFLLGAAGASLNGNLTKDSAKSKILRHIESRLDVDQLKPTGKSEMKFNIFQIKLDGGW